MLKKVLIANRGEIAVRVDPDVPGARASPRWRCTPTSTATHSTYAWPTRPTPSAGETAAESYLNTEAILDAIEQSGADAVHPGYGFFSENTDFARAITEPRGHLHRAAARGHRGHGRQDQFRRAAEKGGAAGVLRLI